MKNCKKCGKPIIKDDFKFCIGKFESDLCFNCFKSKNETTKTEFKKFNERFFITNKINYKFNKNIFYSCFALIFFLLCFIFINYGDYREVEITCNEAFCKYNESVIENLTLIDYDLRYDRKNTIEELQFEKIILGGETLIFAPYEQPFIIKNFLRICLTIILQAFIINHIWYVTRGKNDNKSKGFDR